MDGDRIEGGLRRAAPQGVVKRADAEGGNPVQALSRALDLLECVAAAESGLGLGELGQAAGLPYSEVFDAPDVLMPRRALTLEYFAPVLSNGVPWMGSASQPPPTVDNPPPVLFGRTFDGPMPGHAPGMPWHYDLHVWAWKHNPAGLFAQFNPKVRCP